jgi:rhodanese-related sulfurtransferase
MKKALALAGLLCVMTLSSRSVRAQDDAQFADPATRVSAPVESVSPASVWKLMQDKNANFALVDTQPADGYADGHIPGAINYPWVMQIKRFPIDLPRNKQLIMYGSCPHDTEDMVAKLAEFGYSNVKVMDGGWYKWLELKYPSAGAESGASAEPSVSQLNGAPPKNDKALPRAK